MLLELSIRYRGVGFNCSHCGRNREVTRYCLRQDEVIIQEFQICDKCQDDGYVVKFTAQKDTVKSKRALHERRKLIKISRSLEQGLARDVSGRVQPGSGNQDGKNDVRVVDEWRLEHKFTDSTTSYTLRLMDLANVIRNANLAGEWPGLIITFRRLARKFAIIPYELFLEIVEKTRGAHQHSASRSARQKPHQARDGA